MKARSTVQVRIDNETREQAAALFDRMGLDIPTAIRMFLKLSLEVNGLPFQPQVTARDENGFSLYDAKRIETARKQLDAKKGTTHELIEV